MSEDKHEVELKPYDVREGREVLVKAADGNVYAGGWMCELVDEGSDDELTFGTFEDPVRGENEPARISLAHLFRHTLYTGMTGYGKSSAMQNQLRQNIEKGHGVAFFDPKGHDSRELSRRIPETRRDDLVWFEPGGERDGPQVQFNLMKPSLSPDHDQFDDEVSEMVKALAGLIRGVGEWGARMDTCLKQVLSELIRAEEPFTLLDVYKIFAEQDERVAFVEEFGEGVNQKTRSTLTEHETEDFEPLLKRLRMLTGNRFGREAFSSRDGMAIGDIIRQGKILIARTSAIPSLEMMSLIATGVIRMLWGAARTRANLRRDEYTPFFCGVDELDIYENEALNLGEILSLGRSLRFSLVMAVQQTSQLSDASADALNNCDNIFAFSPGYGDVSEASKVAQSFGCGANRLLELSQYEFLGQLFTRQGKKTEPFEMQSFAPFPPLLTAEEGDALHDASRERYGCESSVAEVDFDTDSFGMAIRTGIDA